MVEAELKLQAEKLRGLADVLELYAPIADKLDEAIALLDTPGKREAKAASKSRKTKRAS